MWQDDLDLDKFIRLFVDLLTAPTPKNQLINELFRSVLRKLREHALRL